MARHDPRAARNRQPQLRRPRDQGPRRPVPWLPLSPPQPSRDLPSQDVTIALVTNTMNREAILILGTASPFWLTQRRPRALG